MSREEIVRQEKTVAKAGALPHYVYFNKISEFAETTDAISADM